MKLSVCTLSTKESQTFPETSFRFLPQNRSVLLLFFMWYFHFLITRQHWEKTRPFLIQGSFPGESNKYHGVWPGFKSRCRCHMWVEFVVGSLLCSESRFFSGYSGFPLSSKTNIAKFQFDQVSGRRRTTMSMCYLPIHIYLFIFIFIYILYLVSFSRRTLWAN